MQAIFKYIIVIKHVLHEKCKYVSTRCFSKNEIDIVIITVTIVTNPVFNNTVKML